MKRTFYIFFIVVVALSFVSCGLRVPSKAPEKVSVKYTKYLEFPITTFDFKMNSFIDSLLDQSTLSPLNIVKSDPVRLTYATEVVYSPETVLAGVEQQLRDQLAQFGQGFSFSLDTSQFLSQLSGQIELPSLNSQSQDTEVDITTVDIPDMTLVDNQSIVIPANGSIEVGNILSGVLPFDEGNFKEAKIELTFSGTGGSLSIFIDGSQKQIGQKIALFIKKNSTVTIKNNSSSIANGTVTLKLTNLKLNYFKNLDLSKVNSNGVLEYTIPDVNVPLVSDSSNWYAKLAGNIKQQIVINGFSGNLSQNITIKSGSVTLGSGSSTTNTLQVPLNETYFKVGDGIQVSGKLTLSGKISADFRTTKPKVTVTPQVTLKAIKDYEIKFSVPRPSNVTELSFKSSSGYMEVNFTGLETIQATTTFGSNTESGSLVKVKFAGVSLPSDVKIMLEATVTGSTISYQAVLPDGQDIIIETAKVSGDALKGNAISINYQIPSDVKDLVDSLDATAVINIKYNIKGINGLKLDIASNFFDEGIGQVPFGDTAGVNQTHSIMANNKSINFSTFNAFTFEATPSVSGDITLSDVNLKNGAYAKFQPELATFEIDNVSLKGQSYDLGSLTSIDFSQVFSGDSAFLKDFDYNISAPISLDIENAIIPATVTITITDQKYTVTHGNPVDIGERIEELLKQSGSMDVSAKIETGTGILSKNSVIKFALNLDVPFNVEATPSDVVLTQGDLPGDLSVLNDLANIIDKASLKFNSWKNTTGLAAEIVLEKSNGDKMLSGDIATANPSIVLTSEQIRSIAAGGVKYKILVPKGQSVSLNYNGAINAVPYIAVELKVATEVKLGNGN
ncbi:MAG TPA: hypothetical protein PK574_01860 [Fervidobacterium sp.]|nr:hypothetical protein [Fervidobacterium sp.]HPT53653.1 hypothetical protein [Fervidobacterium sp.]